MWWSVVPTTITIKAAKFAIFAILEHLKEFKYVMGV